MVDVEQFGLGRKHAPDSNDWRLARLVPKAAQVSFRTYRYWNAGVKTDQNGYPHCVKHSITHWHYGSPVTHYKQAGDLTFADGSPAVWKYGQPIPIYARAQKIDEWPGEAYDGTSVRAGFKAMQELGRVGNYFFADNISDANYCTLEVGGLVWGTNWYDSMFHHDEYGSVDITPDAVVEGGHAYWECGLNTKGRWRIGPSTGYGGRWYTGFSRCLNSWKYENGEWWGKDGFFYLPLDVRERLLYESGECAIATEP